jgi:hypothetical protein
MRKSEILDFGFGNFDCGLCWQSAELFEFGSEKLDPPPSDRTRLWRGKHAEGGCGLQPRVKSLQNSLAINQQQTTDN